MPPTERRLAEFGVRIAYGKNCTSTTPLRGQTGRAIAARDNGELHKLGRNAWADGKMHGLLWDYFATLRGFEIRLFRYLLVYRLSRENIVGLHIIDGFFGMGSVSRLGGHPWNVISMRNRFGRKWIMLEKRCWPRFLAISPKDPDEFIARLRSATWADRSGC